MVTVAVVAVVVTLGFQSFSELVDRRKLVGASEEVLGALKFARSETLKQNAPVHVHFQAEDSGASWCLGADDDTSSACDCKDNPGNCQVAGQGNRVVANGLPSTSRRPYGNVRMSNTFASGTTEFEPIRGLPKNAGSVTLVSPGGDRLQIVLSILGRLRVCGTLVGYESCT
jgi:type IV fimbrial biogenesis protein FimT